MADIPSIQPAGGPGSLDPSRPGKSDKSTGGPSFSDVLDRTSKVGGAGQATPSQGPASPHPPAYIGRVESAPAVQDTVSRASDEFFRLLESYQGQLGNPDASLKDIEPLVQDMALYQGRLMDDIKSLPEGDPGRGIPEEMAGMVTSETAKFYRGEYI
ncbi:MAG: hypothetical protein QF701_05700 [Nitrospinota bacterium]|nr:hypothetical protein [Nitrospinota bacterium]